MTIRRYLLWRITVPWFVVVVGLPLTAFALAQMQPKPTKALVYVAFSLPWVVFLLMQSRVRCPRCGYRYLLLNLWELSNLTTCPKCGVSLDESSEAPGPIH